MVSKAEYTYEDYLNTPEGERYELLGGELVLVASPNMAHQGNQARLGSRMFIFSEDNDLGRVFFSSTDVVLSDDSGTDVVQPDILFISKGREDTITDVNVQGAPDLVVEILSPSTSRRDWRYKRGLYAKYGVKEYWIIDPANRIVSAMLLEDGGLEMRALTWRGIRWRRRHWRGSGWEWRRSAPVPRSSATLM